MSDSVYCFSNQHFLYIISKMIFYLFGPISPFYLPCKKWFFSSDCQYFFMLAAIFCLLQKILPHAKNDECGYWCSQILSGNLYNCLFQQQQHSVAFMLLYSDLRGCWDLSFWGHSSNLIGPVKGFLRLLSNFY